MVTTGSRLADVGTDHGFLPLYLLEQGRIPSGLAMDVNKGPLERAIEHIREKGCQQYIEARLSDGLKNLQPGEADTIVIAGMGGGLIVRILTSERRKLEGVKELILQPQSEQHLVRKCLSEIGFTIADEEMLEEDGKYYVVIRGVPADVQECFSDLEHMYGPVLLRKKHPVLREWLEQEICVSQEIINRLSGENVGEKGLARKAEMIEKLHMQKAALAVCRE